MTNDKRGGELSIQKCDWCKDGYLIVKQGHSGYILGCTNYKHDKSGCGRLLNQTHYFAWRNNDFGQLDHSLVRPSFMDQQVSAPQKEVVPEMIPIKQTLTSDTEHRKSQIYTVGNAVQTIEKDGFRVLVDYEGKVLTDMVLLAKLRKLRIEIARKNELTAFRVMFWFDWLQICQYHVKNLSQLNDLETVNMNNMEMNLFKRFESI